jgi:hypothetical protein
MRLSIDLNLHKNQFMVYWKPEKSSKDRFARFATNETGYGEVKTWWRKIKTKHWKLDGAPSAP